MTGGPRSTPQLRISETEWQQQIIQLAHALGWNHLHVRRTPTKTNNPKAAPKPTTGRPIDHDAIRSRAADGIWPTPPGRPGNRSGPLCAPNPNHAHVIRPQPLPHLHRSRPVKLTLPANHTGE